MKRVTLSDIAKATGFSVNTVSHALNDKADISLGTKELIRKEAKRLGYFGNASASFLRSGHSKTVSIIVPDISNPHFSIMIKEMQVALNNAGYTAILFNTDENEEIESNAIRTSLGKNVDGIIICPVQKTEKNVLFLEKTEIPYVLFGRNFSFDRFCYVVCDNANGGFLAGQKAICDSGNKEILFLNGQSYISSAGERLSGIKKAFEQSNVPLERLKMFEVSPMLEPKSEDIERIFCLQKQFGAVICFSDLIAMHVCYKLRKLGSKVPIDVSVIGFDDIASKFSLPVHLSSVSSSKTLMSVKAVELLFMRMNGEPLENCRVILPTELVLRETTK